MNFQRFGLFFLFVGLLGLMGSCTMYQSGDLRSISARTFFSDQVRIDDEMRSRRIRSQNSDFTAERVGDEISAAIAERVKAGSLWLKISGGVALLGAGILFSARRARAD